MTIETLNVDAKAPAAQRERLATIRNCSVVPRAGDGDWWLNVRSFGFGDCRLVIVSGRAVAVHMHGGDRRVALVGAWGGRVSIETAVTAATPLPKAPSFLRADEAIFEIEGEARFLLVDADATAIGSRMSAAADGDEALRSAGEIALERDLPGLSLLGVFATTFLNAAVEDGEPGGYPAEYVASVEAVVAGRIAMALDAAIEQRRRGRRSSGRPGLRSCFDFIAENYHTDIDLKQLATRAGMSLRALQLGFRKSLNCTISEYVNQVRLANAHARLADPSNRTTIEEVARDSGFNHPGYFAAAFRRQYGESPRDVVRRARATASPTQRSVVKGVTAGGGEGRAHSGSPHARTVDRR